MSKKKKYFESFRLQIIKVYFSYYYKFKYNSLKFIRFKLVENNIKNSKIYIVCFTFTNRTCLNQYKQSL